jgi:hypothetical protein
MRAHAAAFASELLRRHRWGFLAVGLYLVALAVLQFIAPGVGARIAGRWGPGFALAVVVPGSLAFYWMLVVFTFGSAGNFAGRESIFPARHFTLPLTNTALAAWPMLCGATAVVLLWIGVRVAAPWPANLPISVAYLWPGLFAVVLLAWTQALTWRSYPLPGLRVAATVLALTAVQVASVLAIEFRVGETVMVALLAPQLPLAYLVARRAVARARRGDVADWSGTFERLSRRPGRVVSRRRPFASAAAAQHWLEWKRYGRSLPALLAFVLPVELLLLWASRDSPALVFTILVIVVLTPPFLASFTAVAVRKSGEGDDYGVGPFAATRPLSSAALVGARLRMAVWSTAAAWMLVIPAAAAALVLSDTWTIVAEHARSFAAVVGTPRAIGFGLLVLATLVLTTWRQMVQSLYLGLTGRAGLIRGSAFAMLCLIIVIGPLLDWAWDSGARAWFWVVLYWTLGLIVAARMILASWIAMRLRRDGLLADRSLLTGAVLWLSAVAAVYGVMLWMAWTPLVPRFLLLMIATITVPLVRLAAAPLALAWNRHR